MIFEFPYNSSLYNATIEALRVVGVSYTETGGQILASGVTAVQAWEIGAYTAMLMDGKRITELPDHLKFPIKS